MQAQYKFNLVRGEDKSIPFTFFYRYPNSRKQEPVELTGLDFLLVVRDWRTNEELARLSTDDGNIVLGNMVDLEFIEATEEEEAETVLVIFPHEVTEKFDGNRAVFELFAISRNETGENRQCLVIGEIKILRGVDYV